MADGTARYNCENNVLSNILPDEAAEIKASERLEAIINNVMTKELITSGSSREEQILKKQQILGELQKVERELQEKAQAQLLLSAQHQLEQKEQQLQQVLQHVPVPLHKAYQKQLEEQVKRKRECPDDHPDKTDIDGQLAELLNQEIAEGGHNLLANYTEAFNFQPPASPVSGEMNLLAEFSEDQLARAGATVNKNGGKVSIGNPGTEVLPTNSNVDVANGMYLCSVIFNVVCIKRMTLQITKLVVCCSIDTYIIVSPAVVWIHLVQNDTIFRALDNF